MEKKNNVLFCVEFCKEEHPNVYWGTNVPTIKEARQFLLDIGHKELLDMFDNNITDVFEITNYEQAKKLWDMSTEFPHYVKKEKENDFMFKKENAGFKIKGAIQTNDGYWVVIGQRPSDKSWVTWEANIMQECFWGHYYLDEKDAYKDYVDRILKCMRIESDIDFDPNSQIAIIWSIEDVKSIREDLTDKEAFHVLCQVKIEYDYNSEYGITHETLENCAKILYPIKE